MKRHREQGGKLKWILLSHAEIENDHSLIKEVARQKPVGIVHHGGSAERKRRSGRIQQVRDFLKAVRDNGVLVGLSTHDPAFLEEAESQNWDVDFYMTALYYLTRTPAEFEDGFRDYASRGYDLVFGHGFEYQEAAARVGAEFPETVFVTTSGDTVRANVAPMVFELEQATWAENNRIEQIARGRLGMVSPNPPDVVVVRR